MRFRVLVVALAMLMVAGLSYAGSPTGFYGGLGLDILMSSNDDLDDAGFSTTFIGFAPKVGYVIDEMWGVNVSYKYFMENEGDGDATWSQTAITIAGNVSPFKEGNLVPLYFIAGLDMASVEFEMDFGVFGTVSEDDSETGILFGAGYGWWMSDKISFNPEITYVTGDAGGINIEIGARYFFQ